MFDDANLDEQVIEEALIFQDVKPGVDVEQEVRPKGNQQEKQKEILKPFPCEGEEIGHRIGDAEANDRVAESEEQRRGDHAQIGRREKVQNHIEGHSFDDAGIGDFQKARDDDKYEWNVKEKNLPYHRGDADGEGIFGSRRSGDDADLHFSKITTFSF